MHDDGNPRRPEARIFGGAGDAPAERVGEHALDDRDVDARLLQHPAAQDGDDTPATARPRPRLANEAVAGWLAGTVGLDRLQGGGEPVAQRVEPDGDAYLDRGVDHHHRRVFPDAGRSPSPRSSPAGILTPSLSRRLKFGLSQRVRNVPKPLQLPDMYFRRFPVRSGCFLSRA